MKRMLLEEAQKMLALQAKHCRKCGRLYVGGRKGNFYCSVLCARAEAQRMYRLRANV
jgi:uncharacterized Zn finger protein (UPF0148 family)